MKELILINDWERRITNAIKNHNDDEGFPKLEDFNIERNDFDDYIVEKQYLLDRIEKRKNSFVIPGLLLILPVIVVSMFTDSVIGLLASVALGSAVAVAYIYVLNSLDKKNLRKLYNNDIENFINAVLSWNTNK